MFKVMLSYVFKLGLYFKESQAQDKALFWTHKYLWGSKFQLDSLVS